MDDLAAELAREFELNRPRLRAIAYRMLGSVAEAEDVVQDAWLRFSAAGVEGVENVPGWLTTIVTRLCLNALRARRNRREESLEVTEEAYVPDPIVSRADGSDPEHEALLADAVGIALDVILDTLQPAERVAFVLHDMFDVPFDDIAAMLDRTPATSRQLASRARRRLQDGTPPEDPDPAQNRQVVNAFFAAARGGDLDGLVSLLDPDVVLRAQGGAKRRAITAVVQGAHTVATRAMMFANPDAELVPALVNGSTGAVVLVEGECQAVMSFVVCGGHIVEIVALGDPDRLANVDLSAVTGR